MYANGELYRRDDGSASLFNQNMMAMRVEDVRIGRPQTLSPAAYVR